MTDENSDWIGYICLGIAIGLIIGASVTFLITHTFVKSDTFPDTESAKWGYLAGCLQATSYNQSLCGERASKFGNPIEVHP